MEQTFFGNILTDIGTLVEYVVSWVGEFVGVITDNPILFLFVCAIPICGIGIGALNRLLRSN